MALFKYFTRLEKPTNSGSLLTKTEVEEANKAVAKVLESIPKTGALRGKYNSYTSVQRAELGKYAAEHGAAKHFSSKWNVSINELTARRLKMEYLEKLKEASKSKSGESVTVDSLKTKQKGRLLLLGEELDAALFNGYRIWVVRIPIFLFTCQHFSHKQSPNITVHMKASDARIRLVRRHIKSRDSTKALPPI